MLESSALIRSVQSPRAEKRKKNNKWNFVLKAETRLEQGPAEPLEARGHGKKKKKKRNRGRLRFCDCWFVVRPLVIFGVRVVYILINSNLAYYGTRYGDTE